jgi:hypothetical protein
LIRRSRLLSGEGQVTVRAGEVVEPDQIVVRGPILGEPVVVGLADELGVDALEVDRYLQRRPGEELTEDSILATRSGPLGFRPRVVRAPVAGLFRDYIRESGELVLLPTSKAEEVVSAVFPGTVVDIVPRRGVVVESTALRAEGLVGCGDVAPGTLAVLGDGPDYLLRPENLNTDSAGKVLLVGRINAEAAGAAKRAGVVGVVAGSCRTDEWERISQRDGGPGVVILEGLGGDGLSRFSWNGLKPYDGRTVILDGSPASPEADWPELVIPVGASPDPDAIHGVTLASGAMVRITSGPLAQRIMEVIRVGRHPTFLESGHDHPWIEVLVDGQRHRLSQYAVEFVAPSR